MHVVFFHRRPNEGNFSIEGLFKRIRMALPKEVTWEVREFRFHSQGFFKRLFIGLEAFLNQGEINHITGDVNFVALFLKKKKTILTIHDVGFMKHPNPFYRFLLLWFWIRLPVRRCGRITTVSNATKIELQKYTNVSASIIDVIHVPISERFEYQFKEFNVEQPCILQIGTKHNKNVVRLVQALRGISCRLEIVGEIDELLERELKKSAIIFSNSKNLSDDEILDKYRRADIVSFVSTYEGFGMPILEANAVGRVVITSNILSMPEIAGESAHLVDPYNVMSIRSGFLKIINDSFYRSQLIDRGYLNAKRFSLPKIAAQYADIYNQLSTCFS